MGKRGPSPKPTNLKLLNGNPGKRPLPENEPKPRPVVEMPKPPTWMNTNGKKMWKRLAPELERLGLITVIDIESFTAACQSYGTWVECERYLKKHGHTYEYINKFGAVNEVERPEVKIGRKALDHFRSFMSEFGLSPASRTRIQVSAPENEDDLMEGLLSGVK